MSHALLLVVPVVGRPADFSGAVGERFVVRQAAQPSRVAVGQPFDYTLTVTGPGSLADATPPDLAKRLGGAFAVEPRGVERHAESLVVRLRLRPRYTAVAELPAVKWVYYQPQMRRFLTAYADAVPLEVLPEPPPEPPRGPVVAPEAFFAWREPAWPAWLADAAPLALGTFVALVLVRWPHWRALAAARRDPDHALAAYARRRWGDAPDRPADWPAWLAARGADATLAADVRDALAAAERARFAGAGTPLATGRLLARLGMVAVVVFTVAATPMPNPARDAFAAGVAARADAATAGPHFTRAAALIGDVTADDFTNAGRASFLAGDAPRAAETFLRGLDRWPRDPVLHADLAALGSPLSPPSGVRPALLFGAPLVAALRWRRAGTLLRSVAYPGGITLVVLAMMIDIAVPACVVVARPVTLRAGNGDAYDAVGRLPAGAVAVPVADRGGWVKVRGPAVGWVPRESLRPSATRVNPTS